MGGQRLDGGVLDLGHRGHALDDRVVEGLECGPDFVAHLPGDHGGFFAVAADFLANQALAPLGRAFERVKAPLDGAEIEAGTAQKQRRLEDQHQRQQRQAEDQQNVIHGLNRPRGRRPPSAAGSTMRRPGAFPILFPDVFEELAVAVGEARRQFVRFGLAVPPADDRGVEAGLGGGVVPPLGQACQSLAKFWPVRRTSVIWADQRVLTLPW